MGYDRRRRSGSDSSDSRRDRYDSNGHRSRSPHLSKYYRERFGNQSPNHYNNLRLSNFDPKYSKDEVRRVLEREFAEYKEFEIKMVKRENERDTFAYVNFEEPGCAKDIRRNKTGILKKLLGKNIYIDPTGVVVDQEGKYIPDRYNRNLMDRRSPERKRERTPEKYRRRSPPPRRTPPPRRRSRTPPPRRSRTPTKDVPSRTLFLGNIPPDTTESEIKEIVDKYGYVEDMEIKRADGGIALYCFVVYTNIRNCIAAKRALDDTFLNKTDSKRIRAGFGRSQPSRKLWVGELGSWTTKSMLESEFDRYGQIEELQYNEGDEFGYVTFTDSRAAMDALRGMNDFMLEKGHRISVDYARIIHETRKRTRSESTDSDRTPPKRVKGPRTPSPTRDSRSITRSISPARSESPRSENGSASPKITTLEALKKEHMSTWKGYVVLKKVEYPVFLHRVSGSEQILQDYLRDDEGRALKLALNQRLPMDDSLYDKVAAFNPEEIAVAFCIERDRPVSSLIDYLKEKKAAGVVSMESVVTYLLYNSNVTQRIVRYFNPEIDIQPTDTHFVVVIKKN